MGKNGVATFPQLFFIGSVLYLHVTMTWSWHNVLCQCVYVFTCMCGCIICFRLTLLLSLLFACIYVFYVVYLGPHGRLVTPNMLPSLNKELTYLLSYLLTYIRAWMSSKFGQI